MPDVGHHAASMLLIQNADLYAPEHRGLRDLLVGGERVLWIGVPGELADLPAPLRRSCERIDLAGLRVIPGLVDSHVHVAGGGGEAGFRTRVPAPVLGRYTSAGVTTAVGLLGTDDTARGPRELLAGIYALREEGLSAWGWVGGYHLPPATLTGSLRTDLALVEALIGVGEVAISDHRSSQPTFDEIVRLGADAHVAGLMSGKAGIVHLHLGDGPRGLDLVRRAVAETEIPARVWHPTHVNRRRALFEEALDLVRRGCTIDVTAFPVDEGEDAWSAADAVRRYLDSGLPPDRLTVSSDAGGCLPCFDAEGRVAQMGVGDAGALLASIAELGSAGVPLERALPAFTSNPARLLRLPRKGVVEVGGDADLVALDAAGRAHTVIARGAVHVRGGALVRRGTFET